MRLNHDDESVVVIPSITLDRAVGVERQHDAGDGGTVPVPADAAASAPAAHGLRDVHAHRARDHRVLPGPAARRDPEPRPRPALARRGARLVAALAQREAAGPAPAAGQDRRPGAQPRPLPPDPVQHHGARARRRSLAGHPDVRRRPAARTARLEDRVPSDVRRGRRAVPARGGGPADARRAGRRRRLHARPAADHGQRHREAQRGRVRVRQRRRTALRAPRARRARRATTGDAADPGDGAGVSQAVVRRLRRQVRRGRRDRGGTDHRDRAGEPQRAAAGAPRRQGRAALDPRPAAGRRQRAELPGVRVPGGTRVRPADHPRRRADRAAAGARRARWAGSRSTSSWCGAPTASGRRTRSS